MRIILFSSSLSYGGAERQLVSLARGMKDMGDEVVVVTLHDQRDLIAELLEKEIEYFTLKQVSSLLFPLSVLRFWLKERSFKADLVYSMLNGPNLIAALAKILRPSTKLIWGIRSSGVRFRDFPWHEYVTFRVCAALSRIPDLIIANSYAGKKFYVDSGYQTDSFKIISNGIDLEKFHFSEPGRGQVRSRWGVKANEILIGMVARIDPLKDHRSFIEAASLICENNDNIKFVIVGDGPEDRVRELQEYARERLVHNTLIWAGKRNDLCDVFSAFDLHVLASHEGEGFPNVIGEAMACGVPCIGFDVGDIVRIINDEEFIVRKHNGPALAKKIFEKLTCVGDLTLAVSLRNRIASEFSIKKMIEHTRAECLTVIKKHSLSFVET